MSSDTGTNSADAADAERRLREEFPDWCIARACGRWLAARGPLVREDLPSDTLRADTAAELHLLLDARRQ